MTTFPPLLEELVAADAPSGSEDAVATIVRRELAGYGARVEPDVLAGTVGRLAGSPGGRTVGLFAHADEIGAIVTHVEKSGFATVGPLGSVAPDRLLGQRVHVLGRHGRVPGYVFRGAKGEVEWTQLRVDIGAGDDQETRTLIEPGDSVALAGPPTALAGGRVMAKSLDNRVGVYVVTEVGRRLAVAPSAWDVALVVNGLEEGPLVAGVINAAARAAVEVAIVLEVTFAQDVPGSDSAEWGSTALGAGPTVFRGPPTHPAVVDALRAAAAAAGVSYGIEAGRSTWTDADQLQMVGTGVAVGVVAVPIRFMHTASEVAQFSDVAAAIDLVEAFVRALPLDASFLR
jgi:endoglucanase